MTLCLEETYDIDPLKEQQIFKLYASVDEFARL